MFSHTPKTFIVLVTFTFISNLFTVIWVCNEQEYLYATLSLPGVCYNKPDVQLIECMKVHTVHVHTCTCIGDAHDMQIHMHICTKNTLAIQSTCMSSLPIYH